MTGVLAAIAGLSGRPAIAVTIGSWTNTVVYNGFTVTGTTMAGGSGAHGSRSPTTFLGVTINALCVDATQTLYLELVGAPGNIFNSLTIVENGITKLRSAAVVPSGSADGSNTYWQWNVIGVTWPTSGTRTIIIS